MAVQSGRSDIEALRDEVTEKSRQLSELDVMLADYHAERTRLIRDLRCMRARLHDLEEQFGRNYSTPN